jgi:hypothetical protein
VATNARGGAYQRPQRRLATRGSAGHSAATSATKAASSATLRSALYSVVSRRLMRRAALYMLSVGASAAMEKGGSCGAVYAGKNRRIYDEHGVDCRRRVGGGEPTATEATVRRQTGRSQIGGPGMLWASLSTFEIHNFVFPGDLVSTLKCVLLFLPLNLCSSPQCPVQSVVHLPHRPSPSAEINKDSGGGS